MKVFITGVAGFIGFHLARRLLDEGHRVTGFDGVTDYYDPTLKRSRLALLAPYEDFLFIEGMLEEGDRLGTALAASGAEIVLHLAAQAGVRYSLEEPQTYIQSNVVGTANLLEALRRHKPRHFLFASTSSVYGSNTKLPYAETDRSDGPISLYAATKKAGEAMVHSYAHLFGIPSTCLRFFTVYGPWSRPDMASIKFLSAMLEGRPIDVYGQGQMLRDFTYVDDLVALVTALIEHVPVIGTAVEHDSLSPVAPFRTVNIGGGQPVRLTDLIAALEQAAGIKARLRMLPMQAGDLVATSSDTRLLASLVGEMPLTSLHDGLCRFVQWYKNHYGYN